MFVDERNEMRGNCCGCEEKKHRKRKKTLEKREKPSL